MSSSTTTTSLSFKPWARDENEQPALKEILERVNLERGHFRDITEASLQEEIAAEGALDLSSSDDDEDEEEEDEAAVSKRQPAADHEELAKAKMEMLGHINAASTEVATSRDFVALLHSKYNPGAAKTSMSDFLMTHGQTGSLGVDVWDPKRAMPRDAAREAQDKLLATKVRMTSLQESADGLLAAATRLQDNVRKERQFWDEVMAVSERGWSLSSVPNTPFLGVHYGFRGSAPEFARSNVAAITSDRDGNIILERGIGAKPKAARAIIRKGAQIVGSSRLPSLPDDGETSLEARIRHARDSVYDEELFHEMLRESRNLASMGVTVRGCTISFATSAQDDTQVELELVSLEDDNSLGLEASHDSDLLAQATILTARLLLGQEHRRKLNQKKEVPTPLSAKQDESQQNLSILRPLMLILNHHSELIKLNAYVEKMCNLLRAAGASAESQTARFSLPIDGKGTIDTQSLIASLLKPFRTEGIMWLIPSDADTLEFKFTVESSVLNTLGSSFILHAPTTEDVTLSSLEEMFGAANECLAVALARVLKEEVGEGWKLDKRDGKLSKAAEDEEQANQLLWFEVDESGNAVTLHGHGGEGKKEATWKSDGSGESKALKDVWKYLLG